MLRGQERVRSLSTITCRPSSYLKLCWESSVFWQRHDMKPHTAAACLPSRSRSPASVPTPTDLAAQVYGERGSTRHGGPRRGLLIGLLRQSGGTGTGSRPSPTPGTAAHPAPAAPQPLTARGRGRVPPEPLPAPAPLAPAGGAWQRGKG